MSVWQASVLAVKASVQRKTPTTHCPGDNHVNRLVLEGERERNQARPCRSGQGEAGFVCGQLHLRDKAGDQ